MNGWENLQFPAKNELLRKFFITLRNEKKREKKYERE
jgi:hypothetical protein